MRSWTQKDILDKTLYFIIAFFIFMSSRLAGVKCDNQNDFNFDDILNSLDSAVDSLTDYLGEPEGCFFKCKNGETPKPNPKHKPSSNGCGADGLIKLDTTLMPLVTKCCDTHDFCYDTCNENKEKCDDKFRLCLQKVCRKVKEVFSTDAYNVCESTADIMYTGVFGLGCKSFKDSQKNACLCLEKKSNQKAKRNTEL